MSFYQNVFLTEFRGSWVLGDRQYSPNFNVKPNTGRGNDIITNWTDLPTYNLSSTDADGNSRSLLKIAYAIDINTFKNWSYISVDITTTAASTSAVTAYEIMSALNANAAFTDRFTVSLTTFKSGNPRLAISQIFQSDRMKSYIVNGCAEEALRFNARAGVAELPTYFDRHSIANRFTYPDSLGLLILLNPGSSNVDAAVIDNATDPNGISLGYSHSSVSADWQLLKGSSGIFNFQKLTIDGSNRITQIIEYPCGAKVGDFAKLTNYVYTGGNTNPSQITEIPHVIASGDLVSPP